MDLTTFTLRYKVNRMKAIARVGAILSLLFFLMPGVVLLNQANSRDMLAFVLGSSLIGFAIFVGTVLWIIGERCCPKRDP